MQAIDVRTMLQKNLSLLLARSGLSARELSRQAGGDESFIYSVRTGRSKNPGIAKLKPLADFFRITVDQLTNTDLSEYPEIGTVTTLTQATTESHSWREEVRRAEGATVPNLSNLARDIKILGSGIGGSGGADFYFNGEIAGYARRPPGLIGMKHAFAVIVIGDSMEPLFEPGRIAYVTPERAPVPGDYVLVELHPESGDAVGPAFIKRLVRRMADGIIVSQFNPAKELPKIPATRIKHLYRVPRPDELLGD